MKKHRNILNKIDFLTISLVFANIAWMGVIFWFSSHPGEESSQISGVVANLLLKISNFLFKGNMLEAVKTFILEGYFVRKAGHVGEYLILGILVYLLMIRMKIKKAYIFAGLFCLLYAIMDEFHQAFVPGRGPGIADVFLDFGSSIVGIIVVQLGWNLKNKSK